MTRPYAACMLLEHGQLTFREFVEITGWRVNVASDVLVQLIKQERICRLHQRGSRGYLYGLAS